jgi:hypothetical protein
MDNFLGFGLDHGILFNDDAVVFHVSQPWGSSMKCMADGSKPPIMDNWVWDHNDQEKLARETNLNGPEPWSHFLNITSLIETYRSHGESVRVVLMARDPRITLQSQINYHAGDIKTSDRKTCGDPQEQLDVAFDLMMEVIGMPEVTTLCYEQMVQTHGDKYLAKTLSKHGIDVRVQDVDPIKDGNAKYRHSVTQVCDRNARAYMKLCPKSPATKELKRMC